MIGSKDMKKIEEKSPSPFGTRLESNGLTLRTESCSIFLLVH